MDGFSVTALTAATTALSQRCAAAATEIRTLSSPPPSADTQPLLDLVTLADLLEKSGRDADALGKALDKAAAVAGRLQGKLKEALTMGEAAVAALGKELMRLDSGNVGDVQRSYVQRYQRVVLSYSDLFQYYTHIVALPDRAHQEKRLETNDWQHITETAVKATRDAAQPPNTILSDGSDSGVPSVYPDSKGGSSSQPGGEGYVYEEEDEGAFGGFMSSIKAMMLSVLPKPDPLVCALCKAAASGDAHVVKGLLAQGANVEGKDENRDTAIYLAVQANRIDVVAVLIDAEADLKSRNSSRLPPLFQAAAAGHLAMTQLLLDHGCDPQLRGSSGASYFYQVVESGGVEGASLLLDNGANARASDSSGRNCIVAAVKRGSIPMVKLLLSHDAKVDVSDSSGTSLLAVAINTKDLDMVKILLDAGASADSRTSAGYRVLSSAITDRNLPLANLLLSHGAKGDVNTSSGQPLIITVIREKHFSVAEKTDLVQKLLSRGASGAAKDCGKPALRFALDNTGGSLTDIVELLLQHGAKPSKCVMNSSNGETALLWTVRNGRAREAGLLLQHGANANEGTDNSSGSSKNLALSPLVQAVIRQDAEMIRILRVHGAKLSDTMLEFGRVIAGRPEIFESVTRPVNAAEERALAAASSSTATNSSSSDSQRGFNVSVQFSMGRGDGPRAPSPPPAYEASAPS